MKRNTLEHPKVRRLARELGVQRWGAVGILESLWCWAGRYTPRGDVGRYGDADLADAVGWLTGPDRLIAALVDTGWLDRDDEHRLLIHDWDDHADDATRKALERSGDTFATGAAPRSPPRATASRPRRDSVATGARLPVPEPVPVPEPEPEPEPSQSQKKEARSPPRARSIESARDEDALSQRFVLYLERTHPKAKRKPTSAWTSSFRRLLGSSTVTELLEAIEWLERMNPGRSMRFTVLTPKVLGEKLDRIRVQMESKGDRRNGAPEDRTEDPASAAVRAELERVGAIPSGQD